MPTNTKEKILDLAQQFIQERGYKGFSYKDIANELDVATSAIHYHFSTKDDLGEAVAKRYLKNEIHELENSKGNVSAKERLDHFIDLFREVVPRDRLCLFANISADHSQVPQGMISSANQFFDFCTGWLEEVFEAGASEGVFRSHEDYSSLAQELVALVYGAMMIARNTGDLTDFDESVDPFVEERLLKTD